MKRLALLSLFTATLLLAENTETEKPTWNLEAAYNASQIVFYGTVSKSIPEPNFKTGVMGVNISKIDDFELPMEEIIWDKARELSFDVSDLLKGADNQAVVALEPDHSPTLWTHVQNEAGDVFLAQPKAPNPLIRNLKSRDKGLFFVRTYLGSEIPIIYQARLGQDALDDYAILQHYKESGGTLSLTALIHQAEQKKLVQAEQEAKAYKVFEDEYYKILRIQDLDIRTSLLNDLIERMGYKGRWEYYAFKERYMQLHGHNLPANAIPRGPTEGLEKLWHDISGELEKIDTIKKARSR